MRVQQGGPTLTTFCFLADEGREDPNITISGQSLARQRNEWRFAGVSMMAQLGLVALGFFRGSGAKKF